MSKSYSNRSKRLSQAEPDPPSTKVVLLGFLIFMGLLVFTISLGRSTIFSPSCEPIYAEYKAIHEEGKLLFEEQAPMASWNAFVEEAENRIEPLQEKLLAECKKHPSSSKKGTALSFTGLRTEGEKTQAIRRPLMQLGKRLLSEIKIASSTQEYKDRAITKQLKTMRSLHKS